jgi:hypothetical protein
MKRRVKINKLPKNYMQDGGSVNKSLSPVPREEANLEAERGEVALLRQGGEPMTFNIGGKRHSEGGTPLNLEPGSRIFSDTKKMKIKDKEILKYFGAKKPATPAKLAKKYNVNDYQGSLNNPFADPIEKTTARLMINKNERKLDDLFMAQEAKKGFPQGVPGQQGMPMAKYGMQLPKAQMGIMGSANYTLRNTPRNIPQGSTERSYNPALDGYTIPAVQESAPTPAASTLQEREQRLKQLESQRRSVSSDPNLRSIEKDRKMTELNRAIALEREYINEMSRGKVARPTSTEQSSKSQPLPVIATEFPEDAAELGLPLMYTEDDYNFPNSEPSASRASTAPVSSTYTPGFTRPSLSIGNTGTSFSDGMFGTPGANFPTAPELPFDTTPYEAASSVPAEVSSGASGNSSRPSGGSSNRGSQGVSSNTTADGVQTYGGGRFNTPTDRSNAFTYDEKIFFDAWDKVIPGIKGMSNKEAQRAAYRHILENDPEKAAEMWKEFGLTNAGRANPELAAKYKDGLITGDLSLEDLQALEDAYVDGYFGARQMLPHEAPVELPAKEPTIETKTSMEIDPVEEAAREDAKPFEQDLRNERVIGRNRMSERMYLPWRGRLAARTADPTYQSDVLQQQNILAGLNTAAQAASTFGANPGAVMSNIARMSGLAGNQSNQIAAALQRENTGIANQFEQFNSQQQAATDVRNLANSQDLYDNTIKAQDVFDEKMRNYNLLGTAARNATDTNLARVNTMNQLNPEWNINTGQGPQYGDLSFISDVAKAKYLGAENDPTAAERAEAEYQSALKTIYEMQGLSEEDRSTLLKELQQQRLGLSSKKGKGSSTTQPATQPAQNIMDLYNTVGMPVMDPRMYFAQMNRMAQGKQDPYGYYQKGGTKKNRY